MDIIIRKARPDDAEVITLLSKELGYEPNLEEIHNKLRKFELSPVDEILVAEYEKVVGWIHISLVEPLESEPFVEIRGIIVNKEFRKKGIGSKLIQSAEEWAGKNKCGRIRIRTNVKREETRRYYRNLNYISKKIQEVFEKEIKPTSL
jgi:GNAT superfamily N-acetyltransferase